MEAKLAPAAKKVNEEDMTEASIEHKMRNMKALFFLIPFVLGGLTVVQSVMNRSLGLKYGWPVAGVLNNTVGLLFAFLLMLVLILVFQGKGVARLDEWHWWYLLPGCFGMMFVMGIPYAVHFLGASRTFVILVVSQILFGLIWDFMTNAGSISTLRVAGVVVALAGAVMAGLS